MSTFLYISDLVIRDYSVTLKILVTLNVNYSKPEKIEWNGSGNMSVANG